MRQRLALVATILGVVGAVAAPVASAAPVYVTLGQVAPMSSSSNIPAKGGCVICDAWPYANAASPAPQWTFPYDGVITRWSVRAGSAAPEAGQNVTARVFHITDATHATVVREGTATPITTANAVLDVYDRIPASAGDVLGLRLENSSPYLYDTRDIFGEGATAADIGGEQYGTDATVGSTTTAAQVPSWRVNISARFEHDADHDGYGDGSQDLCLGDAAHGGTACSGTLFGSDLEGARTGGGPCNYGCDRVQTKTADGASTAAPARGVVVRWRLQAAAPGTYLVRVIAPNGPNTYAVTGSSDPQIVGADEALNTYTTRIPIAAGGYVATLPPPTANQGWAASPGLGTWTGFDDTPSGTVVLGSQSAGVSQYDADIEPDADGDGYGDVTQDLCPTDASTHGACPPPAGGGGTTTTPTTTTPATTTTPGSVVVPAPATLTALRLRYARFRVAPKGRVVAAAARPHAGTAVLATLSAAATVRFTVRACRSARGCARTARVHLFTRALRAGTTTLAYSGRYRAKGRTRSLPRGRYRLDAAVVGPGGRLATPRSVLFTVTG